MKVCPDCGRCFDDPAGRCSDDGHALSSVFEGSCLLDGRYLLLQRIGRGGMGAVYRARHLGLDRLVAVKVLHAVYRDRVEFDRRFRQEARLLARLRHPHIVDVTDFGLEAEREIAYLTMELLEMPSLAERVAGGRRLPVEEALPILAQIASALDHAHLGSIVHCDLKPSNVLLADGPQARVKVIDFGLAQLLAGAGATPAIEETEEAAGREPRMGTPAFMAPELIRRQAPSRASDLYAFGVLTFAVLTGRCPFEGPAAELLRGHLEAPPPRPSRLAPGLEHELDTPILRLLAKSPRDRPATATAAVEELRSAWHRAWHRAARRRTRSLRITLATVLTLLAPLLAALLEVPLRPVENRLVDLRFALSSPRFPRHPLLLVVLDDVALARDPTALIDLGDTAGDRLARAFSAGAAGVGLDLLLPAQWGTSERFADLLLAHPDEIALAIYSPPDTRVVGPEVLDPLTVAALGPERAADLFGFVNVEEDGDRVVRRTRTGFRDVTGRRWPSFAGRVVRILRAPAPPRLPEHVWVDFTVDARHFPRLSWTELDAALVDRPELFRDRFVLVGGDFAGSGDTAYRVPHPAGLPSTVPGLVLQALSVHTLLDGAPLRPPSLLVRLSLLVLLAGLGAAAALSSTGPWPRVFGVLAPPALWLAGCLLLFARHRLLLIAAAPAAALIVVLILSALSGRWVARRSR